MKYDEMKSWAESIADENGFQIEKELYKGIYYKRDFVRNLIVLGTYENHPAVLKVYNDPRFTDEPNAHEDFLQENPSSILTAPKLYAKQKIDDHRGWMIMEFLSDGHFLQAPLPKDKRKTFLDLYNEYRHRFPSTPHRPLTENEQLTADQYHNKRITGWINHFTSSQTINDDDLTNMAIKVCQNTKEFICTAYKGQEMEWVHGHFKPQEIFISSDGKYYLTDFAHVKMAPKAYELAFIIWADQVMTQPVSREYADWTTGIHAWAALMRPIMNKQHLSAPLLKAALSERLIGTMLMDYGSSDKKPGEIQLMIKKCTRLLTELIA